MGGDIMVRVPVPFVWEHESMKEQKAALVKDLEITSTDAKKKWADLSDDKKKKIEDGYNTSVFVKDGDNKFKVQKIEVKEGVKIDAKKEIANAKAKKK